MGFVWPALLPSHCGAYDPVAARVANDPVAAYSVPGMIAVRSATTEQRQQQLRQLSAAAAGGGATAWLAAAQESLLGAPASGASQPAPWSTIGVKPEAVRLQKWQEDRAAAASTAAAGPGKRHKRQQGGEAPTKKAKKAKKKAKKKARGAAAARGDAPNRAARRQAQAQGWHSGSIAAMPGAVAVAAAVAAVEPDVAALDDSGLPWGAVGPIVLERVSAAAVCATDAQLVQLVRALLRRDASWEAWPSKAVPPNCAVTRVLTAQELSQELVDLAVSCHDFRVERPHLQQKTVLNKWPFSTEIRTTHRSHAFQGCL